MKHSKKLKALLSAFIITYTICNYSLTAYATDYRAEAEARKSLPIESNQIENWPDGPAIGAKSAILMDVTTGTVLYSKNVHEQMYPASTTKILTALIAAEECDMDEIVTISEKAVHCYNWREDSNAGLNAGTQITMEQTLYATLVGSANDAAYAVGEHVSGSMEAFSNKMNEKASALGCQNSHFVNANGLHDDNHYTTAYDLAVIARAFFQNELLTKMASTPTYQIPTTPTQTKEDLILHCKNKLLPGRAYAYEYWIGGKTGYTDTSRQTLVSCAEKDGMKLVCVIMKEESPNQFTDTIELFNYGFSNFQLLNVSENEQKYTIDTSSLFNTENDVLGSSKPILSLNTSDYIILPITATFEDAVSTLTYDESDNATVAKISYEFSGIPVGTASVDLAVEDKFVFDFENQDAEPVVEEVAEEEAPVIFLNVIKIILVIIGLAVLAIILFVIRAAIHNYQFAKRRKARLRRKRRKELRYDFEDLDF